MKTSDLPVIVEHRFNRSIEDVWKALTEVSLMTQWFFEDIPDFKPEVGFHTKFNVKAPSRDFMHLWTITAVIPNNTIVYNWKYDGLAGNSNVTFQLVPEKDATKLIVKAEVIEDFDDAIPEFRRDSCEAGWSYFIKERLHNFFLAND